MKRIFLFLIVLSLFTACKTTQKTTDLDFLDTSADKKPDTVRITNEITKIDTVTLPTIVKTDTIRTDCPPSATPSVVTQVVKTDCPPPVEIVKTRIKYDSITIYKEDTKRVEFLKNGLAAKDGDIIDLQGKNKKLLRWKNIYQWGAAVGWLLALLLFVGIYLTFKRNQNL